MKQVELYNHNKTTYENIIRIFKTSNKCATVQPTGSGKSFLIFKLAQDNSDKTIIVFEPNKQIIGRVSEQMKEYGIDNIKFYTYQKLNSQHKRDEISIDNADYICLDELHRIKAKQWEQAVIAIQEKFPNAKVLGLTATPERMDGQNIINYFGAELACNITLGDAIVNKILPCPTYISALYTFDEEIQRVNNKIDESRNSDEEKNDMRTELEVARKQLENALGVPAILKKHIPDSNGKYIVFCQNVEHLNTMRHTIEEWFTQAGFNVHMYEVHTKNPNHKTEYSDFQADNSDCIKLCLCVDMFNEGVHLEGISGVILLRPTQSNIIYFQQIGRTISTSDKNIPIIFDLVNNGNCLGGGSLRTEIESAVERQREEIAECSDSECDKEVFDIGSFHIYDYVKDCLDVLNGIEDKCFNEFDFRFKQLEEYKEKWGHCCVMKEEAKEWEGLYKWATMERAYYKQHNVLYISQYRVDKLNALDFIWDIDYWKFQGVIERIRKYIDDENPLPIPFYYICDDGFCLGQQIMIYKTRKQRGTLPEKYEEELKNIGINIDIKNYQDIWNMFYDLCCEYYMLYGKKPAKRIKYKNYCIGQWLNSNIYKYHHNKLSQNNQDKIGLLLRKFKIRGIDDCWDESFKLLNEYINIHKEIKSRTVYKNINLGAWYYSQLRMYKDGKLHIDKIKKLQSIGLLKNKNDEKWNSFIKLLSEYLNLYENIQYNTKYKNEKIGQNLMAYRKRYKQNQFPEERYQQLLSLGIDLAKEGSLM